MLFLNFKEAVLNRLTGDEQKRALAMAQNLAEDFDAGRAEAFGKKHADKSWFKDFKLLYDLITDRTFKLKRSTWAVIAGALAYAVVPVDVIPDFILGLGWIDDSFVLATTIAKLAEEIDRYKMDRRFSDSAFSRHGPVPVLSKRAVSRV